MGEKIKTTLEPESVVLVAVINQDQDERQAREYIDELEFLADTAGAMVKAKFFQNCLPPTPLRLSDQASWTKLHNSLKKTKSTPSFLMMN
jgi:GTP-binding protein HflX